MKYIKTFTGTNKEKIDDEVNSYIKTKGMNANPTILQSTVFAPGTADQGVWVTYTVIIDARMG